MTQLAPALAAYTVVPAERLTTRTPYIKIRCSHTGDQLTAACYDDLLPADQASRPLELSELVRAGVFHDDPVPSLDRTHRWNDLDLQLGDIGAYTLHVDVDEHLFLTMSCPYRGGRCPGSVAGECVTNVIPQDLAEVTLGALVGLAAAHDAARYGVPLTRIADLRRAWADRQRAEIAIRETADGPSAGLASARADLIGQMLADIDKVMTG